MVSCGGFHSCAISPADKSLICWGRDNYGQVADTPMTERFDFISSGNHQIYTKIIFILYSQTL